MMTVDFMHSWAAGPMAEVTEDPMHQADMHLIQMAGMFAPGSPEGELKGAIERVRARGVWCYEEGGRRYATALQEYRWPD